MDETSSTISNHSISFPASLTSISTTPAPERQHRKGSVISTIIDGDGGAEAESSRKLHRSRFKGVVAQYNGRWGAQIYEKHQRVWLGTFNHEHEAAKAYDIAARRFRGCNALCNFDENQSNDPVEMEFETNFLNSRSKSEIVDMLRKHTYTDELKQSMLNQSKNGSGSSHRLIQNRSVSREHMFEKTVTPSDVGKLNRLVIPKQHAEKHFPLHCSNVNGNSDGEGKIRGVLLNFEDVGGKVWRFRYSYWKSSQSYVLTKGWNRFVKEKELSAGDVVSFDRLTAGDRNVMYIDCKPRATNVRLFGVDIFGPGVVEGSDSCAAAIKKRNREFALEYLRCQKQRRAAINAL